MMAPQFFALDATQRAVGNSFAGRAVIDDMDGKPATQIAENSHAGHRLAPRPETELLQTIPGQVGPADFDGVFEESHGANPDAL